MKNSFFFIWSILLMFSLIGVGLFVGSVDISLNNIIDFLINYNPENPDHYVLLNLRMPRILLALLVGSLLSLSGYLAQTIFNNPLADPYMLGTASGASIGANLVHIGWVPSVFLGFGGATLLGFIGAFLVTFLAAAVAYENGKIIPTKLLLTGVAISSLATAIVSLFTFIAEDQNQLRSIVFWIMGSFDRAIWEYIPPLTLILLVMIIVLSRFKAHFMLMILGEERANDLGLNVNKLRWVTLFMISIMVSICVATSGPIGFVGLIIPHLIRGHFGISGKHNLLFSAVFGANFMLAADLLSRVIYQSGGLPIGIITSICGIPFFIWLLNNKKYKFGS